MFFGEPKIVHFWCHSENPLKGIVHPKMKILCLSSYLQGLQDVGEFVSSVEHKWRFLTRTDAVCQSYNGSQWDMKQSVCARNWTVFISFFTYVLWHSRRMRGSDLSCVYITHCLDRFRACVYYARARWCVTCWLLWTCSGQLDIAVDQR